MPDFIHLVAPCARTRLSQVSGGTTDQTDLFRMRVIGPAAATENAQAGMALAQRRKVTAEGRRIAGIQRGGLIQLRMAEC